VVFGAGGTAALFAGFPAAQVSSNLRFLSAFTLVALLMGVGLFRYIVEE